MAGYFPVSLSYGVFITFVVAGTVESQSSCHDAMPFDANHDQRLEALQEQLRACPAITPELLRDVMARACPRLRAHPPPAKAKLDGLIAAGAWIDAVLALLKLELPQWMLRRLIYDDGEWHCSLSKHPALPVELDDSIEAVHEHPALALLSALVEARRISAAKADVRPPSVPQGRATPGHIVCCDNFA